MRIIYDLIITKICPDRIFRQAISERSIIKKGVNNLKKILQVLYVWRAARPNNLPILGATPSGIA